MTAAASLVSTLTSVTWANLGAGYLANRLCQRKITYRSYDRGLYWATGKIHWQTSWSFVISLILFTSTTLHAAAFTAVFGLHPMIEQYPMNGAATNISMNAQLLLDNVMAGYDIAGNDFDVNLAMLVLQWGNHTAGQISELTVDEVTILASAGMVLGAEVAVTTVPRLASYSTNVDPRISKILQTNYGLSNLEFESAGVQGTTTCTPIIQSMNWTAQTILDTYTIYNFSSPTCGQRSRAHDNTVDIVYDAYACLGTSNSSVITGIIRTSPINRTLDEALECYTTLWDTFGNATYREGLNKVDVSTNFTVSPMTPPGVVAVTQFTNMLWIQTMGRSGSPGLRNLVQIAALDLDSPAMILQIQDAVSYMYAIGGAKLIDVASTQAILSAISGSTAPPYLYRNTSMTFHTPVWQLGYGSTGRQYIWLAVLVLNVLMASASAVLLWFYPVMPLDPTSPLSMVLLALNSPQADVLYGVSIGTLPSLTIWQKMKKCYWCTGRRGNNRKAKVVAKDEYKNVKFRVEEMDSESDRRHFRLMASGERGGHPHLFESARHVPEVGKKYN